MLQALAQHEQDCEIEVPVGLDRSEVLLELCAEVERRLVAQPVVGLVLDFTFVQIVPSPVIGWLCEVSQRFADAGQKLTCRNASAELRAAIANAWLGQSAVSFEPALVPIASASTPGGKKQRR